MRMSKMRSTFSRLTRRSKNFSYTVVDGEVFYRENSVMTQVELSDTAKGRVTGMVELRQIVNDLIDQQLNDYPDEGHQGNAGAFERRLRCFLPQNTVC